MRLLLVLLVLCVSLLACVGITVNALPNGFLLAMLPMDGVSNHIFPYSVNPATGDATVLGDGDYIMASLQNTQNGGTYNPALKQVQIIGQSLTEENPTMNFLVSVDNTGEYTSSRLVSYDGLVYTARAEASGRVFGMAQSTGTTDARIDIIEDTGLCTNYLNTTSMGGYLVGYAAVDSDGGRFFVAVKNASGQISLLTADTHGSGAIIGSCNLPNPTSTRLSLCYDTKMHALYALERLSGSQDSVVLRIDSNTCKTDTVATLKGRATVGDCYSGTFFASGPQGASSAWIANVDLASGMVTSLPFNKPAPTSLVFFPQ